MIFLYALASGGGVFGAIFEFNARHEILFFFKKTFLKYLRGRRVPPGFGKPWGDAVSP